VNRDHDAFEALAGAVMLGEATEAEREHFDAHAATCDECRADVACAPVFARAVTQARRTETWRPSIANLVLDRIRGTRKSRFRFTVGALGWAVAISIVFNLALASGLSMRFGSTPADDASSNVTAMTLDLESPAPRAMHPAAIEHRPAHVAIARRHTLSPQSATIAERTNAAKAEAAAEAAASNAASDDVDRVLAGIDLDGSESTKHVAVEPRDVCSPAPAAPAASDAIAADASPPCVPPEAKR
jgi:hypothetical protein